MMQLYHGDCLEELKQVEDGSVDMVLTDPPYSSGGLFAGDRRQSTRDKYTDRDFQGAARLPDFSGDNMDQRSFTEFSRMVFAKCRRKLKPGGGCCPPLWTGETFRPLRTPFRGLGLSGEGSWYGIRGLPATFLDDSARTANTSCGGRTDRGRCPGNQEAPLCRAVTIFRGSRQRSGCIRRKSRWNCWRSCL